jgi:hypothetical protein
VWRFDQPQLVVFTVLALFCGVGSVEQVKSLVRGKPSRWSAWPPAGAAARPAATASRTDLGDGDQAGEKLGQRLPAMTMAQNCRT